MTPLALKWRRTGGKWEPGRLGKACSAALPPCFRAASVCFMTCNPIQRPIMNGWYLLAYKTKTLLDCTCPRGLLPVTSSLHDAPTLVRSKGARSTGWQVSTQCPDHVTKECSWNPRSMSMNSSIQEQSTCASVGLTQYSESCWDQGECRELLPFNFIRHACRTVDWMLECTTYEAACLLQTAQGK